MSNKSNFLKFFILAMLVVTSLSSIGTVADTVDSSIKPDQSVKLVIGTRHDSSIYTKFKEEFVKSDYAAEVGITHVDQIQVYNPSTYDSFKRVMTLTEIGADIGWGGGPTLFNTLAADGALSPITDPDLLASINAAVPDTLAGTTMKEYNDQNELIWASNAISSFGFTVNNKVLQERGLEKPTSWEDLASPDFFTTSSDFNIGLGNAPDTTSNTRIYQIILQKFGWEKGWEIIYQMAANGKIFGGSVETRSSVISGETAVAMTIDFYGLIAMSENPDTEYIIPANASIVNGDPIALALNPPHIDAARAFIQFTYSQEGQAVWLNQGINRLPVREDAFQTTLGKSRTDIYNLFNNTLSNQGIEFSEDLAASLEEPMRYHFQATITNVHSRHRTTWATLVNAYKTGNITEAKFDELRADFVVPAMTMEEAISMNAEFNNDQAVRREKEDAWFESASTKYDNLNTIFAELGLVNPTVEDIPFAFNTFVIGLIMLSTVSMAIRKKRK